MEKQVKPAKFQLVNFLVSKSSIEIKSDQISEEFNFKFYPKGIVRTSSKKFELNIGLEIEDKNRQVKILLKVIGNYTFHPETETNELNNYFFVNAPAILFPYIRAYISSLTALSGISTVTMPTLNMQSLGKDLKENTQIVE